MKLLSALQMGSVNLKNRVVLAPMTRSKAGEGRLANSLMAEYYTQRASAGLLITEATVISKDGVGWQQSPAIWSDGHVESWKQVTAAVHDKGAPIFLQLWHCGRASHSSFPERDNKLPAAPSAIKLNGDHIHTPAGKMEYETPRALEKDEILQIVKDYGAAAQRAKDAGFDGIEIHAANGYLLDQFLQSKTNQREDEYGGSIESRYRLLDQVLKACIEVWPADRIGVRLAPNGAFNDMGSPDYRETFTYVASQLNHYQLAYLHVMDGLAFGFHELGEPMTLGDFRKVYDGPLMGNCGYSKEAAEEALASGAADLVSFGRPFISNPDLVERFENDWPLAADADMSVWYSFDNKGYVDFPRYGKG
ncbi:alkene reductase [Oligoflexia bacterium]|nr:alkene reductase [Oligoflexia bacterium]